MKTTHIFRNTGAAALLVAGVSLAIAQTEPVQKPLLSSNSGARSNVMLILDNSGSMAWPFTDTYNVTSSTNASTATAANPARFTNPWLAQRAAEVNAVYYNPRFTYAPRVDANNVALSPTKDSIAINGIDVPPDVQFVSNTNSVRNFFTIVAASDAANWSANAGMQNAFYEEYTRTCSADYCLNGATDARFPWDHPSHRRWIPNAIGNWVDVAGNDILNVTPTPSFVYFVCGRMTAAEANPPFPVLDANGKQTNCNFSAAQYANNNGTISGSHVRVITRNSTQTIPLPFDHERTDCGVGATTCTNALEITNIVNWYKYYGTRATATATAIGRALASNNLQGGLRIGYYNLNRSGALNTELLGVANAPRRLRGVRLFDIGANAADTRDVYSWLYGHGSTPRGGTPLHRPLINAGEYYRANQAGQTENPWRINPALAANAATNPELSCRRSFAVLFSDGAWTNVDNTFYEMPPNTGGVTDFISNINAPTFTGTSGGNAVSLAYRPTGPTPSDIVTRKAYTPYNSTNARSFGLADVASYYNWFSDLRPNLANQVPTRPGKPVFWQNMSTYTVGYMVRPSGANGGAGLSFPQIDAYRSSYYLNGLGAGSGTVNPTWPSGNLTGATEPSRIDDFIHAGYAGGARSFSVNSADQIKRAFDSIFAETSDGTGNDAGVAVALSTTGGASATSDTVKYTTEYATGTNAGDVIAWQLDANGDVVDTNTADTLTPTPLWSAKRRLNDKIVSSGTAGNAESGIRWRRLFTRDASGNSVALHNGGSTITAPAPALMTSLDPTGYFPTDGTQMLRYLLGDDSRLSRTNVPLRQRESLVGASVNSPPLLVYNNQDMAYYYPPIKTTTDASGTVSNVVDPDVDIEGRETYRAFLTDKGAYPPVIMSANNSGTVQVFNAARVTNAATGDTALTPLGGGSTIKAGEELAAFMPLGIGSKLRLVSDETYLFEYLLDGRMSEEDIFQKSATTSTEDKWRQIVVGTSGRARMGTIDFANPATAGTGRFIYALNAPFIDETSGRKRIPSAADFLWERSWPALGHVSNITTAGQLSAEAGTGRENQWVVLSNSGHFTNTHGLYVLNALTGAEVGFIPTTGSGDGLGGVVALRDANRRIIGAYAGDANGNLWRFDLTGTWSATRLHTTDPVRPIYAAPSYQMARGGSRTKADGTVETCTTELLDGKCGTIVVFGTGMLLQDADRTNTDTQSIYGIWDANPIDAEDTNNWVATRTGILTQSLVASSETAGTTGSGTTLSTVQNIDRLYRVTTNPIDYTSTHKGWKLNLGVITSAANANLTRGERILSDVNNIGRSVVLTSTVVSTAADSLESCGRNTTNVNVVYVLRATDGSNVAGFRDTNGRLRNFSVGLAASGGFDNAILAGRGGTSSATSTTEVFNPYTVGKTNESIVAPSESMNECTKIGGKEVARSNTSVIDGCVGTDWQRTWRQLTAPPQ